MQAVKPLSNLVVKFYFPAGLFFENQPSCHTQETKQNHHVIAITRIAATVQFSRRNLTQLTVTVRRILLFVACPKRPRVLHGGPSPIFNGYSSFFPEEMQPGREADLHQVSRLRMNGSVFCLSLRITTHQKPNFSISIIKPTRCTNVSTLFYFGITLYMFRTVFLSIIRGSRLYI